MNCGYCLNDETCHLINGRCSSGCQSGFQVPLCANEHQETEEQKCTSRSPLLRRYAKERMKKLDSIPSMRDTKNLGNSAEVTQLTITYCEVFLGAPGANKNINHQNMCFLQEALSC
ncbi:uncharacterized protein LOC111113373 [Crassostrea virginica]